MRMDEATLGGMTTSPTSTVAVRQVVDGCVQFWVDRPNEGLTPSFSIAGVGCTARHSLAPIATASQQADLASWKGEFNVRFAPKAVARR